MYLFVLLKHRQQMVASFFFYFYLHSSVVPSSLFVLFYRFLNPFFLAFFPTSFSFFLSLRSSALTRPFTFPPSQRISFSKFSNSLFWFSWVILNSVPVWHSLVFVIILSVSKHLQHLCGTGFSDPVWSTLSWPDNRYP